MNPSGDITLKTLVNTRASLASRVPKKKKEEPSAFSQISLHHSKETTYDIDYTPKELEEKNIQMMVSSGAYRDGRFGNGRNSGLGGRNSGTSAGGLGGSNGDGNGRGSRGSNASNGAGGNGGGGAGADNFPVEENFYYSPYKTVSHPSSLWESEAHAATRHVQPVQQLDFYSNVRKIEAKDDEERGGLVGSIQRSMEVAAKRATDPQMRMADPHYVMAHPCEFPVVAAHERQILKKNYLDLVECEHLDPDTEQQIGYNAQPETRLPGLDLSQEHSVQSKAITRMGTSEELFRGFPKYTNDKPVTYAGHIPYHPRNLAAMHGDPDCRREYAKSIMTLATHGGGVDSSVTAKSIRARMRRGKNAPALQMLKPKTDNTIRETTEGNMLQQPFHNTTERERQMNFKNDKMGHLYF